MDPGHADCFAQAQVELRELFHELECNGHVSAAELQRSLIPFTAGDVRRDLQELVAELRSKRQSLDEAEFLRVMWRKMYLASAIDATKGAGAGQHKPINVSLAHVIVSVKRRQQLRQFAGYYASRGISGADHLTSPVKGKVAVKDDATSPKNSPLQSPANSPQLKLEEQRGQPLTSKSTLQASDSSSESITALRRRVSPCYDVVACVYDEATRQMQSRTLFTRTRSAEARNCSRLYCLLFTKEVGGFVLGCTYFGESARRNHQKEKDEYNIVAESETDPLIGSSLYQTLSWGDRDDRGFLMVRMEELGLRNIVAAAANRGSFAASTGRKMHQWRALEPYRVRENGNEDDTSLLGAQSILFSEENNEEGGRNTIDDKQGSADPTTDLRLLDTDPTGDCFGLLGGKPLLARTKTIADVGDLRQLAAGEHFFLALSSSSTLYTWESQASTSSGLSFTTPSVGRGCAIPEQVPWFSPAEKVFRVACGAHHVLALTSSGLYAWGSNLNGQLGLGSHCSPADPNTVEPAPVCLRADCTPVLDVACGDTHSIVLSASGQILTFGCNWEGQLGIDQSQTASAAAVEVTGCAYEPLLVTLPRGPEIRDAVRAYLIAAGPQTTAVVATTGQIFQWGKCVPDGVDGVCGRISRFLPEELKAANKNNDASVSGPVWHSIAIADGLVVLTRHANLNSVMPGV